MPGNNPWECRVFEECLLEGTGTFGRVYLVKSKSTGEFLALKCLGLKEIIASKQVCRPLYANLPFVQRNSSISKVEHVHSEKQILAMLDHPFIIKLYCPVLHIPIPGAKEGRIGRHWAYRDSKALYLLFDFIHGGELFSYLRSAKRFTFEPHFLTHRPRWNLWHVQSQCDTLLRSRDRVRPGTPTLGCRKGR